MIDLFVDDVRRAPDGWILATTIHNAKAWLMAGAVDRCSLDHDMGACEACIQSGAHIGKMNTPDQTFYNWCPHHEDGTKLVQWMIETGHWPRQKPSVHSANPVGAERMRGLINRYWPERTVVDESVSRS